MMTSEKRHCTPAKKFPLRLDPVLHARLVSWAKHEERSMHAQIVWVLRQAVEQQHPPHEAPVVETDAPRLAALEARDAGADDAPGP